MTDTAVRPASMKRTAAASFTGTALEWYDYYLFGTAAALVFNTTFFTDLDPVAGTLASFAAFAVGFVARPVGAAIFGHFGDRSGRKKSLMATIIMMGVVTGAIGLLPAYEAIGVAAPILLVVLRILQGIAMGGEWSGASALITEQATQRNRGFYAMLPQLGNPVGILLGVGLFTIISNVQTPEAFVEWGWRIPFLLAIPFMLIGIWIRASVQESHHFVNDVKIAAVRVVPVVEIFRIEKTRLVVGIGVALLGVAGYYFADTFLLNYGTGTLGLEASDLLNAGLIASIINIPLFLLWGAAANRYGGIAVALFGGIATMAAAIPMFILVQQATAFAVAAAMVLGSSLVSISYAASGQILNELFVTATRQSGIGLAYNFAGTIAGFVPFIATLVINASGDFSIWATALMLIALAGVTVASVLAARRIRHASLSTAASQARPSTTD